MEELSLTNLLKIKDKDLVRFDSLKGLDRLLYTEEIISEFLEESKEEVHRELGTICLIDAIILNEDRNLGNILYLKDKDRYTQCLIFDNSLSLLSNLSHFIELKLGDSMCGISSTKAREYITLGDYKGLRGILSKQVIE